MSKQQQLIYNLLVRLWPLSHVANWLGRQPIIGRLVVSILFGERVVEGTIIPVRQTLWGGESVALPYLCLEPLLTQASFRFLMKQCVCRSGEGCQNYPRDLGCIFLGEGARELGPEMGCPISTEEALDHVRRAVGLGLVPLIVHSSFDALMLGIRRYERMLALCFCCDCCCTVRGSLRNGPRAFWERIGRLPGLQVSVNGACVGCGTCVPLCHVQAIRLEDGRARIGDACKGCGRCAAACPREAIHLTLPEGSDVLRRLQMRIRARTDIGPAEDNGNALLT